MGEASDETRGAILILDDEPLKRITLQIELGEAGFHVVETSDARTALRVVETQPIDVIVTDLKMPGMDGLTFLEHVRERRTDVPVIVMTAFGTVDTAVEAMKRGAYDYITKPFKTDVLLSKIDHLLSYKADPNENDSGDGQQGSGGQDRLGRLVVRSHAMQLLARQLLHVADNDRPVLIAGQRGTGKSFVAEAIHDASQHRDRPFQKLTSAGQTAEAVGRLLQGSGEVSVDEAPSGSSATGGTVYFEEVEALPMATQTTLAALLGEHPVSSSDSAGSCRVLCGSHTDLAEGVTSGTFREDLYYRLSVQVLRVPPLRDRKDDLPQLVRDLVARRGGDGGCDRTVSHHAMDLLVEHDWPGNLRELELVLERALSACPTGEVRPEHLPPLGRADDGGEYAIPFAETSGGLNETVANIERRMIESALSQAGQNQAKAAQILNIPRTTLRDKIAKYGLAPGPGQMGSAPSRPPAGG